MTWTDPTGDLMYHGPSETLGALKAGGTISVGQAVYISSNNTVHATTASTQTAIGVCMYDATDGDYISVHSIGCKVQARLSGTCSAGDRIGAAAGGWWTNATAGTRTATVIEGDTNDYGDILIHL